MPRRPPPNRMNLSDDDSEATAPLRNMVARANGGFARAHILLLGLRGTHFGDGKGILWSNNVLWTRVGAPSCGPGCVLT